MKILTIESRTYGKHDVLLDDDDYDRVINAGSKWSLNRDHKRKELVFYVVREIYNGSRKNRKRQLLHRFITGAPKGFVVDHIDGNTLNNTKENLRVCTPADNARNNTKRDPGRIGVREYRPGRWSAKCSDKWLGTFNTPEEAARAYDEYAKVCYGEFATLNFPDAPLPAEDNK